jgi:cytochrome c-type biogenesis protein CcmH
MCLADKLRKSVLVLILLPMMVLAVTHDAYRFDTAQKEQLFHHLLTDLRCLVCQNQNLLDSNATLAVDLKKKIYLSVKANQTEKEIKSFLVKRYGDFILFNPPVKNTTLILWFFPLVMLVIGLLFLIPFIRRKNQDA